MKLKWQRMCLEVNVWTGIHFLLQGPKNCFVPSMTVTQHLQLLEDY